MDGAWVLILHLMCPSEFGIYELTRFDTYGACYAVAREIAERDPAVDWQPQGWTSMTSVYRSVVRCVDETAFILLDTVDDPSVGGEVLKRGCRP